MTMPSISPRLLEARYTQVPYPTTGYGRKVPTSLMVRCQDNRWRRVYSRGWSNATSCFIVYGGAEHYIHDSDMPVPGEFC